jgi:hypothetical protein
MIQKLIKNYLGWDLFVIIIATILLITGFINQLTWLIIILNNKLKKLIKKHLCWDLFVIIITTILLVTNSINQLTWLIIVLNIKKVTCSKGYHLSGEEPQASQGGSHPESLTSLSTNTQHPQPSLNTFS